MRHQTMGGGVMIAKMDGFQIPEDHDALRRLYEQIRSENMHLLRLLADNGIPYIIGADQQQAFPVEAPQEGPLENSCRDTRSINSVITTRVCPTNASNCICRSLAVEGMYMPANGIAKRGKEDTVPPAGTNGFGANAASQRPDSRSTIADICT